MAFKKGHTINLCRKGINMMGDKNPAKRPEVREKIRQSKLGKARPDLKAKYLGKGNPNWKGEEVSYAGIHAWVKRHKPKTEKCEKCTEQSPYDLANLSGKYKRDINDYQWLCRSCHSKMHRGKEWGDKMMRVKKVGIYHG